MLAATHLCLLLFIRDCSSQDGEYGVARQLLWSFEIAGHTHVNYMRFTVYLKCRTVGLRRSSFVTNYLHETHRFPCLNPALTVLVSAENHTTLNCADKSHTGEGWGRRGVGVGGATKTTSACRWFTLHIPHRTFPCLCGFARTVDLMFAQARKDNTGL